MTYKVRIESDVAGPAYVIVPISESLVDRAVFNACVRRHLDSKYVSNVEELMRVYDYQMQSDAKIMEALKRRGEVGDSDADMLCIEEAVLEALR